LRRESSTRVAMMLRSMSSKSNATGAPSPLISPSCPPRSGRQRADRSVFHHARAPPRRGEHAQHWTNSVDRSYSSDDVCGTYHVRLLTGDMAGFGRTRSREANEPPVDYDTEVSLQVQLLHEPKEAPLKIALLVKEVPDTYGDRKLNLETGLADRGASEAVLDEIGERALEVALAHKDADSGAEVTVI